MTQHALPDLLREDPNGLELAELINNWNAALLSAHSGPRRPPYAVRGTIWVRDTGDAQTVMFFDGNADREMLTGAALLALLKTVDGANSGLDADKLDGLQASNFLRSDISDTTNSDLTVQGNLRVGPNPRGRSRIKFFDSTADTLRDLFWDDSANDWRIEAADGINGKLWHEGNDGADSGLDADKLDGLQASQFLRADRDAALTGTLTATGTVSAPNFASISDARLKSDIDQIESALALTQALRGVRYTMDERRQIGVIAQDVRPHIPEVVSAGEDGYLRVAYGPLVAVLIEAVKELAARVEVLEGTTHDAG